MNLLWGESTDGNRFIFRVSRGPFDKRYVDLSVGIRILDFEGDLVFWEFIKLVIREVASRRRDGTFHVISHGEGYSVLCWRFIERQEALLGV